MYPLHMSLSLCAKKKPKPEERRACMGDYPRCYAYAFTCFCLASNSAFIAEFVSQQRLCVIQSAL